MNDLRPSELCVVARDVRLVVSMPVIFLVSETPLHTELNGSRPVCVERMQERSSSHAIGSATPEARGIFGTGITANDVVSTASRVVEIEDSELSLIEDIEELCPELNLAGFFYLELLEQRHVEVQAVGIVQKISASIAEGESARRHKLRRIPLERAEAAIGSGWSGQPMNHVGIRGRDAETARHSGVIGERNPGIAGTVDHREGST